MGRKEPNWIMRIFLELTQTPGPTSTMEYLDFSPESVIAKVCVIWAKPVNLAESHLFIYTWRVLNRHKEQRQPMFKGTLSQKSMRTTDESLAVVIRVSEPFPNHLITPTHPNANSLGSEKISPWSHRCLLDVRFNCFIEYYILFPVGLHGHWY